MKPIFLGENMEKQNKRNIICYIVAIILLFAGVIWLSTSKLIRLNTINNTNLDTLEITNIKTVTIYSTDGNKYNLNFVKKDDINRFTKNDILEVKLIDNSIVYLKHKDNVLLTTENFKNSANSSTTQVVIMLGVSLVILCGVLYFEIRRNINEIKKERKFNEKKMDEIYYQRVCDLFSYDDLGNLQIKYDLDIFENEYDEQIDTKAIYKAFNNKIPNDKITLLNVILSDKEKEEMGIENTDEYKLLCYKIDGKLMAYLWSVGNTSVKSFTLWQYPRYQDMTYTEKKAYKQALKEAKIIE